jgi:hypothetical protein
VSAGDVDNQILVRNYRVSIDDVITANKRTIFLIFVPLGFVFGFFGSWIISTLVPYPLYMLFITAIVTGLVGPFSFIKLYRWRLGRPANRRIFEPADLTIDSEFLSGENQDGVKSHTPWTHFVRAKRVGDLYLLYQTESQFHLLSRAALGEQAADRVDEILVSKGLLSPLPRPPQ